MTVYDYRCIECGSTFEYISKRMQSESERTPKCDKCGMTDKDHLEYIIPLTPFQLKGSGWFKTSAIDKVDPTTVSGVRRIKKTHKSQEILHKI